MAVLLLAFGCAEPDVSTDERYASDQRVLVVALKALTTYAGDDSPVAFRGKVSTPVAVSSNMHDARVTVEQILDRQQSTMWSPLTQAQERGRAQAANDLASRAARRTHVIEFRSESSSLSVVRPSGGTTLEGSEDRRMIRMWPPGYSADGGMSIVRMSIPWSMHECIGTFVLERQQGDWVVVAQEFIYHV
jgi:hypothetical protein